MFVSFLILALVAVLLGMWADNFGDKAQLEFAARTTTYDDLMFATDVANVANKVALLAFAIGVIGMVAIGVWQLLQLVTPLLF